MHSYADLLTAALDTCRKLEGGSVPLRPPTAAPAEAAVAAAEGAAGPRVALFAEPGADYVAGQYATWLHRGITVPLCLTHPDRWGALGLSKGRSWCGACMRGCPMGSPPLSTPAGTVCHVPPLPRELQYAMEEAEVSAVLASERHAERMHRLAQASRPCWRLCAGHCTCRCCRPSASEASVKPCCTSTLKLRAAFWRNRACGGGAGPAAAGGAG